MLDERTLVRLTSLGVRTTPATEWAWVVGRIAVVAATAGGAYLLLADTPAFVPILASLLIALAYNAVLAALLLHGRTWLVFALGFVLDNLTLLFGWWIVLESLSPNMRSTDLYLILFPVLSIGVARLGWALGLAYAAAWLGWLAWTTVHYYGPGSWDMEQLPLRLLFLAITTGLILRQTSRFQREQQRAEAASTRYRTLFATMSDPAFVATTQGVLADLNEAACRLLGAPEHALRGRYLEELVAPEHRPAFAAAFQRTLQGHHLVQELRLLTTPGDEVVVELRGALTNLPGERLFLGVARDLTERRRLEQRLIQTERLSAIGQLVSGVAHELSNPLTTIVGLGELLAASPPGGADSREVQLIVQEAARAGRIVRNLLDVSRRYPLEIASVDVVAVLERILEVTSYTFRDKGIRLERRFPPGLPPVPTDAHRLEQVFLNLLTNAGQAVEDVPEPCIMVSAAVTGDTLAVSISDNGPGIPPQDLGRIFEPFFTTKEPGKGTGLGLYVCYAIVHEHGGRITVDSTPGHGATFTVELPLRHPAHPHDAPAPTTPAAPSS